MLRVVLDTNVLVSAIISEGKPRELLRRGIAGQFSIVTSAPLLKELSLVLRRPKFRTSEDEVNRIVIALMQTAEIVNVTSKLKVVEDDPKDNMVIETAYDGSAELIITGDGHLLALRDFKEIKIITVEQMLTLLEKKQLNAAEKKKEN